MPENISGSVSSFTGARNITMHGNAVTIGRDQINMYGSNDESVERHMNNLASAACLEAGHEIVQHVDRPKCHHETRQAVIRNIMSWVDSDNPHERIMWLQAPVGSGKSSIAQSICIRCQEEGKLLSSFFFSRTAGGPRADGGRLIATIAYHLALVLPEAVKIIVEELKRDPALLIYTSFAMDIQLKKLVLKPLSLVAKNSDHPIPFLVVIDGLDECYNAELQAALIRLFTEDFVLPGVKLKCFIASRPELEIRNMFSENFVSDLTSIISLDNKEDSIKDIQTYLFSEFSSIKRSHTLSAILSKGIDWPNETEIMEIAHRSSGQFVYAATIVKYVSDKRHNPMDRLQDILCIQLGQTKQYKELDALYIHIMESAAENADGYEHILPIFQMLLHTTRKGQIYISSMMNDMAALFDISKHTLLLRLVDLHSVLHISPDSGAITILHKSFTDFLSDQSRSERFFVDKKCANKFLARRCLARIIENFSGVVTLSVDSYLLYSRGCYMWHLLDSGFDEELLEELLIRNKDIAQQIMDQILMQEYLRAGDDSVKSSVKLLYTVFIFLKNVTPNSRSGQLIAPLNAIIYKSADAFALTILTQSEQYHIISLLYILDYPDTYGRLIKEILEDPERGKEFYLGSSRCQHIWVRLWKVARDKIYHDDEQIDQHYLLLFLPTVYEYLLQRIKPSICFKTYLENWFYTEFNTKYIYKWMSLEQSVIAYLKTCISLNSSVASEYKGLECEDVPLHLGVTSPWVIVNEGLTNEYITYSSDATSSCESDQVTTETPPTEEEVGCSFDIDADIIEYVEVHSSSEPEDFIFIPN